MNQNTQIQPMSIKDGWVEFEQLLWTLNTCLEAAFGGEVTAKITQNYSRYLLDESPYDFKFALMVGNTQSVLVDTWEELVKTVAYYLKNAIR